MRIQYTDKKTFELIDSSERKLGQVAFDGLMSYKASLVIGNDNSYKIVPKGFFDTTIFVTKNDMEIARMSMSWKGHFNISFLKGREYTLKPTGNFLTKYLLEDSEKQKVLLLNPDFKWAKLNYNFTITYDTKPEDILLVLLAAYSATYYIAVSAG